MQGATAWLPQGVQLEQRQQKRRAMGRSGQDLQLKWLSWVHTRPELKGNHITTVEFLYSSFSRVHGQKQISAAQTLSLLFPSSFPFPCLPPVLYIWHITAGEGAPSPWGAAEISITPSGLGPVAQPCCLSSYLEVGSRRDLLRLELQPETLLLCAQQTSGATSTVTNHLTGPEEQGIQSCQVTKMLRECRDADTDMLNVLIKVSTVNWRAMTKDVVIYMYFQFMTHSSFFPSQTF